MSDDDQLSGSLPLKLCCEICWTQFHPQQFGAESIEDVPQSARCPRCGGDLCQADPN